jgi:hypothetical protein
MAMRVLILCLTAALLLGGSPALAHVSPDSAPPAAPVAVEPLESHVLGAGERAPTGLSTVLAAGALLAVAIARRRRAVALLSVAVLVFIAFETGLHSVHHIGDRDSSSCVVASASAQTGGVTIASVASERPAEVVAPVAVSVGSSVMSRVTAPDRGRAPPTV